jgi:hypothetical protein
MEATFARMTEGLEPIPDYMVPPEAAAQPDFVSDYATGRALQPGEEEDAAAGFPMTMNDLQNKSSPAGNGWGGQDELPVRPEQYVLFPYFS